MYNAYLYILCFCSSVVLFIIVMHKRASFPILVSYFLTLGLLFCSVCVFNTIKIITSIFHVNSIFSNEEDVGWNAYESQLGLSYLSYSSSDWSCG